MSWPGDAHRDQGQGGAGVPSPTAGTGTMRSATGELFGLIHFPGTVALVMVLPPVILGPLAFAIRDDFALSQSDIGTAFAAFFLSSALVSGLSGAVVRRFGAPPVVRYGLFGTALVAVGLAMSQSRNTVYAATLAGGTLNGITAVAISLTIMSTVTPRRRGLAFGLRTAGLPSAAALAGLGAYLVAGDYLGWRHVLWVIAGISIAAGLSIRGASVVSVERLVEEPWQRPTRPGSRGTLWLLGLAGLLGSCGAAVVTPFLVEGLIAQGQSPEVATSVLALAGWFGIVSRVLVGAISDRIPNPLVHLRLSAALQVVLAASMVMLALGHGASLLVGATLTAFGIGLAWPGLLMFATLATHQSLAASAAGKMQFGQHSGAVFGPLSFGFIAAHYSFSTAWMIAATALIAACILITFIARSLRGIAV